MGKKDDSSEEDDDNNSDDDESEEVSETESEKKERKRKKKEKKRLKKEKKKAKKEKKKERERRDDSDDDDDDSDDDKKKSKKKSKKKKKKSSDSDDSDDEEKAKKSRRAASVVVDDEEEGSDVMDVIEYRERSKAEVWMRRILLLPANPEEETQIKRYLRYLAYGTLFFDMTAAIVSLVTFGGISYCCGEPILNMASSRVNWQRCVQAVIVMYLVMLVLEIYPVIRQGFPFNLVNPIIGFLITFAVFFDDAKTEALIMWGLESIAVSCEFAIYRLKTYQCRVRAEEIKELMPKTTRKADEEFSDEEQAARELKTARRKFYVLRREQAKDVSMLRWLWIAVYMNFVLTSLVLVLILVIARSGGLCIQDLHWPNPFDGDQIGRCYMCDDPTQLCEICTNKTKQCYFPYS